MKGAEKVESIARTGHNIGRDLGMRVLYVYHFGHIGKSFQHREENIGAGSLRACVHVKYRSYTIDKGGSL